jgi:tRNA(adenine34) deaminase
VSINFLNLALVEAQKAFDAGEVPVGCVIVQDNHIIATGYNQKEKTKNPLHHAEIIAIQSAAQRLGDWRLTSTTLYSTLEPCPMCAGAILHARIDTVIFGAYDLKWGATGTKTNLFEEKLFNHTTKIIYQPMKECEDILKLFFQKKRAEIT